MNRAGPSVNIQVRLKYQDSLKNPVELGPGMHHSSGRPHQAAATSAPGQPALPSHARDNSVARGPATLGQWGYAAGVMPAVAARVATLVACAVLVTAVVPAVGPKTASKRGRCQDRTGA